MIYPRQAIVNARFIQVSLFCCLGLLFHLGCNQPIEKVAAPAESTPVGNDQAEIAKQMKVLAEVHFLDSKVLNERRQLNVYVPPHYAGKPDEDFPVVYLLDGAFMEDYHHVSGLIQFLTYYELMPPSIMVGIANVDRYRDFTYPSGSAEDKERLPTSGGSKAFRTFLSDELKPFIDKTYRTGKTDTLLGQSLGGLLATEVFVKTPDLFDNYFIISPSLWWDNGGMLPQIDAAMAAFGDRQTFVYLALGEEGEEMQAGMDHFTHVLRQKATAQLSWHYESFPQETHATILHRALYAGFEKLYGATHPGM